MKTWFQSKLDLGRKQFHVVSMQPGNMLALSEVANNIPLSVRWDFSIDSITRLRHLCFLCYLAASCAAQHLLARFLPHHHP
eukprot:748071-Hanusia_phi.AAC.1